MIVLDITARIIDLIINVAMLGIIMRTIMSFFADEDNKFAVFLACITEPFIIPARFLLNKFNILQDSPIDWSTMIAYMVLAFVGMMFPAF